MGHATSASKTSFKGQKASPNLLLVSSGLAALQNDIAHLVGASLRNPKTVLYVPYAVKDQDQDSSTKYFAENAPVGINVIAARACADPVATLEKVDGVVVGGGNTFRLLDRLQKTGLLEAIKQKVGEGMPYIGSSAGTIVVCPTIMVNNDPPIVYPASFNAMGFVPFQIKPHYDEVMDLYAHVGDGELVPYYTATTDGKINEFHEENTTDVLGLPNGTALRVHGKKIELLGDQPAKLFRQGKEPVYISASKDLEALANGTFGKNPQRSQSVTSRNTRAFGN